MITTFLWMLYLALMLLSTYNATVSAANIIKSQKVNKTQIANEFVVCLLWSIWYFYYLN